MPKGTNGGVSVAGLLFSFLGGAMVGLGYWIGIFFGSTADALSKSNCQLYVVLLGGIAGLLGSVVDSVLGAVFQFSGIDTLTDAIVEVPGPNVKHISGVITLLNNHGVNLFSSIITAAVMPAVALYFY